jgi:GLPGLI family protein
MRNFILLIFCLYIGFVNAQSLTGIYVLKPISGVGDSSELNEYSKIPDFYLYSYSNNKSNLEKISKGGTKIDTIKGTLKEYNFDYETIVTNIKPTKTSYYKNLEEKTFERVSIANDKEVYVKDKLPLVNWKITQETKTIEGYLCTKAIAEKTVVGYPLKLVAWFCDKIPINDGPFEYIGLPGFILEFGYQGLSTATFINLKYNPKENISIEPLKSTTKPMTIEEFEKSLR